MKILTNLELMQNPQFKVGFASTSDKRTKMIICNKQTIGTVTYYPESNGYDVLLNHGDKLYRKLDWYEDTNQTELKWKIHCWLERRPNYTAELIDYNKANPMKVLPQKPSFVAEIGRITLHNPLKEKRITKKARKSVSQIERQQKADAFANSLMAELLAI